MLDGILEGKPFRNGRSPGEILLQKDGDTSDLLQEKGVRGRDLMCDPEGDEAEASYKPRIHDKRKGAALGQKLVHSIMIA